MKSFQPSRRQVMSALAGTGAALLLGPDRMQAAQGPLFELDPRVPEIVARTITVDMHNHVEVPYVKNPADSKPDPETDLASEIRRSGFIALCETCDVDTPRVNADDYYKYNQQVFAFDDRLFERNHIRRALTLKDLEMAHAQRQPIVIQACEGGEFIEGHLERVEEAYKRGLRNLQLVHERDDKVAPLGDFYTAAPHLGGLTDFGAQVIRECNRLGIMLDLAHGTDETIRGALKATTQPLMVSHISLTSGTSQGTGTGGLPQKLIGRDVLRAIADGGGVIGVWWRFCDSVGDYVASVRAMVDAVGIDHVGMGTDTSMISSFVLPFTNRIWPDQNYGFFYSAADAMLKHGFAPEEIGKIGGGNFCRLFNSITARHS
jgi:membrane dipeptidase